MLKPFYTLPRTGISTEPQVSAAQWTKPAINNSSHNRNIISLPEKKSAVAIPSTAARNMEGRKESWKLQLRRTTSRINRVKNTAMEITSQYLFPEITNIWTAVFWIIKIVKSNVLVICFPPAIAVLYKIFKSTLPINFAATFRLKINWIVAIYIFTIYLNILCICIL